MIIGYGNLLRSHYLQRRHKQCLSFGDSLMKEREKLGQFLACGPPQDVTVDIEAGMDEPIAHGNNLWPRNCGCHGACFGRDFGCRLADDFNGANEGKLQHEIGFGIAAQTAATKRLAASPASIMWRKRVMSSGGILDVGIAHDLVAEVPAQVLRRAQVDRAAANEKR